MVSYGMMNTNQAFEAVRAGWDDSILGGAWITPCEVEAFRRVKGAYGLLIALEHAVVLNIRKLKTACVEPGLYLYVGSAYGAGGIGARLARHFKAEKTVHWHVDRLTVEASRLAAFGWPDGQECTLVSHLLKTGVFEVAVAGFGSSDCQSCPSHLLTVQAHTKR